MRSWTALPHLNSCPLARSLVAHSRPARSRLVVVTIDAIVNARSTIASTVNSLEWVQCSIGDQCPATVE
jgi:hypothetical protein